MQVASAFSPHFEAIFGIWHLVANWQHKFWRRQTFLRLARNDIISLRWTKRPQRNGAFYTIVWFQYYSRLKLRRVFRDRTYGPGRLPMKFPTRSSRSQELTVQVLQISCLESYHFSMPSRSNSDCRRRFLRYSQCSSQPILWTHEIIQTTVFFCLRCETKWKNRFVRAFTCRISITLKSDKRKGVWHWSTNDLSMDFCQLQDQSTRYNTKIWSPSYHHFWRFLTESLLIKENHILLETESWLRFSSYKKIGELCSV